MEQRVEKLVEALQQQGIPFTQNEPMVRHTTFLVGGAAAVFIRPASTAHIATAQLLCRQLGVRLLPLGRGSNLLVADAGLPFAVLYLGEDYSAITRGKEDTITVQAGAKLTAVCRFAATQGLAGLEFSYGIPGSMGGAVYMNAGAYGGECKDIIKSVTFLDEGGQLQTLQNSALCFGYRHSLFSARDCIVLEVTLELSPDDPIAIREAMDDYMNRRREKQPLEYGSAGSTFKRPAGAYASALIDRCGLKGYTVGGAQVSQKHAGFVVNTGSASCADVLAVMAHVTNTVKVQTGFVLEPEIKLLP